MALALAYRRSEVSFVYPATRGLAPLLVLGFAVLWLGHHASAAEVGGVLLVCVGVVWCRPFSSRLLRRPLSRRSTVSQQQCFIISLKRGCWFRSTDSQASSFSCVAIG